MLRVIPLIVSFWTSGQTLAQVPEPPAMPGPIEDASPTEDTPSVEGATTLLTTAGEEDTASLPGVEEVTVYFGRDLGAQGDLMLQGIASYERISFSRPAAWTLADDPRLVIAFDHSGSLLPDRSGLTISVNGSAVASAPLTDENLTNGTLEVPIPRQVLEDYNTIQMEVVQHIGGECEDPFDPSLWTRISQESHIIWTHRPEPVSQNLDRFPEPFLDLLGYGPLQLTLVGAQGLSDPELDTLGVLGFALGRHAHYRTVDVQPPVASLNEATTHSIVIGTPAQQPIIADLLETLPAAGEGVVALTPNPSDPNLAVLIVTGGDAQGLLRAARAIAGENRQEFLSGSESTVTALQDAYPARSRQSPLPAPKDERFDLEDIGISDQTVRGYYANPVRIPLRIEGDAKTQIGGARIGVDYAYSAQLDTRLSTMEVRLNGTTLRSVALDEADGEEKVRLWVELPFELVVPNSEVEVVFHLFPRDFNPCVYTSDHHIWATVFASTPVELARDHYTDLPDLELLRHDLWPYGEALQTKGVRIITSDHPDSHEGAAVLQVAAELGRRSIAVRPNLMVNHSHSGILEEKTRMENILLIGDRRHTAHEDLIRSGLITHYGKRDKSVRDQDEPVMKTTVSGPYGSIEQVLMPVPRDNTALVVRAPDSAGLLKLIQILQRDDELYSMSGNVFLVGEDGAKRDAGTAKTRQVGSIPWRSRLKMFIRGSWFLLGIGVLIGSAILSFLIRTWAAMRGGQAG